MRHITMGMEIGGFIVGQQLGEGGMGAVYQGFKPGSREKVAIKFLQSDLTNDAQFRQRFEREIVMMQTLRHPNIVPLYDSGQENGLIYFVMQLINGVSLEHMIKRDSFSPLDGWEIFEPITQAIDFAHQHQVIHRDIKPANILIETVGEGSSASHKIYLTDFGLSKLVGAAKLTKTGAVLGTPHYMSPEQIMGQELTSQSDIYALGVVVYETLCGRLPFDDARIEKIMSMHVRDQPPPLRSVNPNFPDAVESVILKALAKKSSERYGSAGEFAAAYVDALQSIGEEKASQIYWAV